MEESIKAAIIKLADASGTSTDRVEALRCAQAVFTLTNALNNIK